MNKKLIAICIFLLGILACRAQMSAGKIVYERKTNLYKKMGGGNVKEWIKEADKIKIDYFDLFFNDTCSVFLPQESVLKY